MDYFQNAPPCTFRAGDGPHAAIHLFPACRHTAGLTDDLRRKDRPMPTGTVKWFNTTKGFGFIAPDGGGQDVFVHISALERSGMTDLPENTKVSYELRTGRDGRQSAVDLKKIG